MIAFDYEYKNHAEIDLCRLVGNFKCLTKNAQSYNKNAKPICVVKADAYGHGARECVRALEGAGADFFAVSDVQEAFEVREVSPSSKILILGYANPKNAPALAKNKIIQALHSYEYAMSLERELSECNEKLSVHIKLDTGMSRIGFATGERLSSSLEEIKKVCALPHLCVEGVFSHLACADEVSDMTDVQIKRFDEAVSAIRKIKGDIASHICNTAASMTRGSAGHDYFRLGISLYGYLPSYEMEFSGILPVMSLYSTVAQVHTLHKGDCVSYGATYCAERDMQVATVAIGYADGLMRASTGAYLYVNGQKAKILGRVCMDQCIVCIDGLDVKEGDEVTLYDRDGQNMKDLSRHLGTISYELACAVGKRIPRIYMQG